MASGNTLVTLLPQDFEPPATSPGRQSLRASSDHPVVFLALTEIYVGTFIMPRHYAGGGITVYLHYAMTSAVANDIRLDTAIERIGDQQQDIDTNSFATAVNGTDTTVPGTSGLVDIINNAHTDGAQMDSLAVGELGRLKVLRTAVAGTDATGDLELRGIEIKET